MRILFISNLYPDNSNATRGQDNANLLHYLSEIHDIQVISTRPIRNPLSLYSKVCPRPNDVKFYPIFLNNIYLPKIGSLVNHLFYYYCIRKDFINKVINLQPDIILSSWTYPDSCAVTLLAHEFNLPLISIVQGSDAHIYMCMPLRSCTIRNILSQVKFIVPRSKKLGDILSNKGLSPSSIYPIYNGVDKATFTPADKKYIKSSLGLSVDTKYLLYVGNFYAVKNPQLLVNAFNLVLKSSTKRVHLLLIGEGYLKPDLEKLSSQLHIADSVSFLGRQPPAEVAKYMQSSEVLCIPSFNEGLPNVLLESLSCGLPVVSTNVGGISEVLFNKRCGTLVESFDTKEFSAAIFERLSQETDVNHIVAFSEKYSWPQTVSQYNHLFELALKSKRNEYI